MAMKMHLTLNQRIHNAEGAQATEYLHAKHAYLHAKAHEKEEYSEIWTRSEDASWAHSFGRWRGWKNVWWGHVANYNLIYLDVYRQIYDLLPEVSWLTDFRSLGELAMHSLSTDIIEVAGDGKTARASFLTPGVISSALHPDMKWKGFVLWERYGADFVFEDGEWKYLHEQVCPDLAGHFDASNAGMDSYKQLLNPPAGGLPPMDTDAKRLQDIGPLHFNYTIVQTVQNTVPWPEPYLTMDNNNTYTKKK
jgi:hypothetical protein